MTIIAQLQLITAALTAWAQPLNYKVERAHSFKQLWALFTTPGACYIAVMYTGFDKAGTFEEASRLPVNHNWLIVISTGKGLLESSDTRDTAGRTQIYTPFEQLLAVLRAIEFSDSTDGVPDLKTGGVFTLPDGSPLEAMQVELAVGTRLSLPPRAQAAP